MKRIFIFILFSMLSMTASYGQYSITGNVISSQTEAAISGAEIKSAVSKTISLADRNGQFRLTIKAFPDTIIVKALGYKTLLLPIDRSGSTHIQITLNENIENLKEVEINTGIYRLPRERATGSFTFIDQQLLNRAISANIIDRLEGVTNGLNFDRKTISRENLTGKNPDLRIHGVNTIESNESPLIVLDNFPYEGDLSTINPNDVESVTLLKDAAAASIWGARAGNGVIVITTKSGRYNQKTSFSFLSTATLIDKPNLFYNKNQLPSDLTMSIEKQLFDQKAYREEPQTQIPLYVELLIKKRDGLINETEFTTQEALMKQVDIREQALKYLYQKGLSQQYALNLKGGSDNYKYYFSAGNDRNKNNVIGNNDTRLTLNLQNTYKPLKALELSGAVWYTKQRDENNGIFLSNLGSAIGNISPYALLKDAAGNPQSILRDYRFSYQEQAIQNGLKDWQYKPLEDISQSEKSATTTEMRLDAGLKFNFLKDFRFDANYQYISGNTRSTNYYGRESYYVRNLVNKFTQSDGKKIIPDGAIFEGGPPVQTNTNSGRLQLNYQHQFRADNELTALAGMEIREQFSESLPGFQLFNYNKEILTGSATFDYNTFYPVRPRRSAQIPAPSQVQLQYLDRFLSYYANMSDTYLGKYTLSASIRKDASNIFGVNINQKGVPLWSAGSSWEISKEKFYNFSPVPYLRLRMTYGSSGNVNKSVSVFPTAIYSINSTTNLNNAALTSAGNPDLRWEKVKTFNAGMDMGLKDQRIQFSAEYYIKSASDLIGIDFMDPSTGIIDGAVPIIQNKINYAGMRTKGLDLMLTSANLIGPFKWQSTAVFNYVANRITNFNTSAATSIASYLEGTVIPPAVGRSKDLIYALPWNGLSHQTGLPVIYMDGNVTTDYSAYYQTYLKPADLVQAGVTSPPYTGSLRNTFSYKGFQLAALLTWKAGYVFRRNSMLPGAEWNLNNLGYHVDYFKRWKSPGDEFVTNVPANSMIYDDYLAKSYSLSSELITKGDHIRLQDMEISYAFSNKILQSVKLTSLRLYVYARNLGIVWRANKENLDPDYPIASYPSPRSIAFGLQTNF